MDCGYTNTDSFSIVSKQMTGEDHHHRQDSVVVISNLRAQVDQLTNQLGEKDHVIDHLQVQLATLESTMTQQEEKVNEKVRLIRDHIERNIKTLEAKNNRLKKKCEDGEDKIQCLNKEVSKLKEINRAQSFQRTDLDRRLRNLDIENSRLKRQCEDTENSRIIHLEQEMDRLKEGSDSSSTSEPLYSSIDRNDILGRSSSPQHFKDLNRSPPLPPRRTSASSTSVRERLRSSPVAVPPPIPPHHSSHSSVGSPVGVSPQHDGHYPAGVSPQHDHYYPTGVSPVHDHQQQNSPLGQREDGDGSDYNEYDEIPIEHIMESPLVGYNNNNNNNINNNNNNNTSNTLPRSCRGTPTPPIPCHYRDSPPQLPQPRKGGSLDRGGPSPNQIYRDVSPHVSPHQGRQHAVCPVRPSKALPPLPKPTKAHWESLLDSLALVGFTDSLPSQKCVKSSIGKVPRYILHDELPEPASPFRTVEPTDTKTTESQTVVDGPPVTEVELQIDRLKIQGACPSLMCALCLRQYPSPFKALTNLTSPYLTNMALKIHQIILDYSSPASKQSDLFTVSRTLVSLLSGELVNEAYMQLLVGLSGMERCCYHLVAVLLPFYPPSGRVLVYLKMYLETQNATGKSRFPAYCLRILQRSIECGPRKFRPCRQETEATSGSPYQHAKPMSIPIHLPGGEYHVTGFDPSSSVAEVICDLELSLGIRPARESGYTLLMEDPVNRTVRVPIAHSAKLCDVIAKWETNLTSAAATIPQVIGLHYEKFLHLPAAPIIKLNPVEKKFCALQLHTAAMEGVHGMEVELATCLGAMIAQATKGNCPYRDIGSSGARISVGQFIPGNIRSRFKDDSSSSKLAAEFIEIWQKLRDVPSTTLYQKYCTTLDRWKYNKSTLFRGLYSSPKDGLKTPVCVNVTEKKLTIINADKLAIMEVVEYDKVSSFGGSPFSLTLKIANKTFSIMLVDKHKSYLLIELLAAYCRRTTTIARDTP